MFRRAEGLKRPSKCNMEVCKRLLSREAEVLRLAKGHPNIPLIRDYSRPNLLFVEFHAFNSLDDYIECVKKSAFDEGGHALLSYTAGVISIARQVCDGLWHMANQGVMLHGDVKPSNIVYFHDGDGPKAQLIDFGFAYLDPDLKFKCPGIDFTDCQYTAPEINKTSVPKPAPNSDVYSLGIMLFNALSPFVEVSKKGSLFVYPGLYEGFKYLGIAEQLDNAIVPMTLQNPLQRSSLSQARDALQGLEAYIQGRVS